MRVLQPLLLLISFLAGASFAVVACARDVDEQEAQYATLEEEQLILKGNIFYPAKKSRPKRRTQGALTQSSYSMQDQAEIARALETLRLTAPKTTPPETAATIPDEQTPDTAATIPDEQTPDTAAHANSSGSIKNISLISQRTSDNATLATDELPGERQTETVASKSIPRQEAIASTPKTNLDYSLASVGGKPEVGPMASLLEQDLGVADRKVANQTWDYRVRIKRKSIVVRVTY